MMIYSYLLEECVKHLVSDLLGPRAIDLVDLLCVGIVSIEASELALLVPEQEQEVGAVAAVNDVQDALPGLLVDGAGVHDVLHGVQDDRAIGLARWLTVQTSS